MKTLGIFCFMLVLTSSLQAQWTNGQNAAYVIGQAGFTTNVAATTATGLKNPWGLAVDDVNQKLYVVDWGNHRVLRYALPITQNQPAAELVLGQANFTSGSGNRGGSSVTANTLNFPKGIAVYHDTLWVADYSSERVLRFDNAHAITTNGANANAALGGSSALTGYGNGTGQSGFYPNGLFVDGSGNLYVTDNNNQRIVRFNNPSAKASGANADGVLGQPDYTTTSSGTTAAKFNQPYDGVFIGTTLFVVDYGNHRVLKFNNAATKANGANADGVFGAADFTTAWNGSDVTWLINNAPKATGYPMGIAATGSGELLVCQNLPRISIFANAASIANFSPADNVLGQPDLGTINKGVAQNTFPGDMRDICYSNALNQLFAADFDGNRVMVFNRTTTGVENTPEAPRQFALSQNYPNPFNPSTTITFSLQSKTFVSLKIFDMLGREVAVLVNEQKPAGNYTRQWNAATMTSGVYFYRLQAGTYTETKKLVLLR
jgi:sugar lactone lactonase YvrE